MAMTNTGYHHTEQQPYMQVAQQHSMAQPGFQQEQFLLQQQTPMGFPPNIFSTLDEREQMEKEISDRIKVYNQRFGKGGQPDVPKTPPQQAVLPTPPNTIQKPTRASLDVAPMPNFIDTSDYTLSATTLTAGVPLSPTRSLVAHQTSPMPSVFEEAEMDMANTQASFPDHSTFLESSAQTALDLGISFSPTDDAVSPHTALIQNADMNASIEETGISADEVQAFVGEQDPASGKYTCLFEGCGKKFGRRENVKAHIQTHLGDRRYKCGDCQKRFVRSHDLKRHLKIHSGERPYLCLCGGGFTRHDALTRHRTRGGCIGAFPNCRKREAKRGRPKKSRPEMDQRVEKANRARRLDRIAEADPGYHSSTSSFSSGASQASDVMTPPDSNIFDANNFIDMQGIDDEYAMLAASMEETLPTSQVDSSPPKSHDDFDMSSTSNEMEYLSMTTGVSPEMLTFSPPSSQLSSSPPAELHIEDSHSSPMGTHSPSQSSVMEPHSDDFSAATTPCPKQDDAIIQTLYDIDNDPLFNDSLHVAPDNMDEFSLENLTGLASDFDPNDILESNLNDWAQHASLSD
ncbi:MAG: hypothetical protein M1822_008261 [Bathelium mastoideum]|nr:MAG: hypothetical protein M1822_008261 [Bathelium mastoideum]